MKKITKDKDLWIKIRVEELEPRQEFVVLPGGGLVEPNQTFPCPPQCIPNVCYCTDFCFLLCTSLGSGGGGGVCELEYMIC